MDDFKDNLLLQMNQNLNRLDLSKDHEAGGFGSTLGSSLPLGLNSADHGAIGGSSMTGKINVGNSHNPRNEGKPVPVLTSNYNSYITSPEQIPTNHLTGRCSRFGGHQDPGDQKSVAPSGIDFRRLDSNNGMWVALRTPDQIALGLAYGDEIVIRNRANGKTVVGILLDYGPAEWTGKRIDLAFGIQKSIGVTQQSDDFVVDFWKNG